LYIVSAASFLPCLCNLLYCFPTIFYIFSKYIFNIKYVHLHIILSECL
jgi:hypothetical protein